MLYNAGAGSGWPSRWSAVRTMTVLQSQLTESLPTSRPVSEGQLCRRRRRHGEQSFLPRSGTRHTPAEIFPVWPALLEIY